MVIEDEWLGQEKKAWNTTERDELEAKDKKCYSPMINKYHRLISVIGSNIIERGKNKLKEWNLSDIRSILINEIYAINSNKNQNDIFILQVNPI